MVPRVEDRVRRCAAEDKGRAAVADPAGNVVDQTAARARRGDADGPYA